MKPLLIFRLVFLDLLGSLHQTHTHVIKTNKVGNSRVLNEQTDKLLHISIQIMQKYPVFNI